MSTLRINDRVIPIRPRETVLQAALRADVPFPNSCRVGGCGTCKCRLASGEVDELTETGYLLSREELDRRVILACQSVPTTDVAIEVELATVVTGGTIVGQDRVTHDITRVAIQLDEPLPYKAGQFANVSLPSITASDGAPVTRSYSFATPARADGRVELLVREVPGGRLSTALQQPLIGARVRVEGPHGDLWLRPGTGPLLLVAGGSGLAPLLALLHDAVARGVARPVTLLFGARTQRDLYAQDELAAIARAWAAPFRFVPVLSDAADDATWTGARGLVTEHLPAELAADTQAYLCGPPAMIDGAVARLEARGLARAHLHVDRFVSAPPAPAPAPAASVWHYLKFFLFHAVGLTAAAAIFAGGAYVTGALLAILAFYIVGDALAGDDTATPRFTRPGILTAQLWLALPLLGVIVAAAVASVRDGVSPHTISTVVLAGLMVGMVGTITAHELTHRTWDPISMRIGRWLLAFSFDAAFSIEHVYGHHRYVATTEDPATAPRGRNVYHHVVASTIKGNVSAWRIEAERLAKQRRRVWSRHNAVLRGYGMSLALVAAAFALGGWRGAALFVAAGLWAKALLEIVNYMEHYGIVRDPATPVQPRHSWNTNRRISSWSMFNLTRHSHHHAQGEVPYQELRPYADAPMMINGYLTTLLVAMIPPLWHRLMTPKVLAWDRDFATDDERRLAAAANARSGRRELEAPRPSFA